MNTYKTQLKGYALVNPDGTAFSWHPTHEDATERCQWENRYMGRSLRVVKDVEAIWPEVLQ